MSSGDGEPEARGRLMDAYGLVMSVSWIALWLLPILYVGSARESVQFLPRYLRDLHAIACLFPDEVTAWSTYHAEAWLPGNPDWIEIDLEDYFKVQIFGYHTHVARILGNSYGKVGGDLRIREVAEYMRREYERRYPDEPAPLALRFVRARHPVASLAQQEGCFRRRPLLSIPWAQVYYFGEVRFDGLPPSIDHGGRKLPRVAQ